jgi:hypothetical protein
MSHKPDREKVISQELEASETSRASRLFLLADYGTSGLVEVELVDHPVSIEEPQFEALVADSQCEV